MIVQIVFSTEKHKTKISLMAKIRYLPEPEEKYKKQPK